MKAVLLGSVLIMVSSFIQSAEAAPKYFVILYEHPNFEHPKRPGTGRKIVMLPRKDGSFNSLDELTKYGMQDQITVVQYCLPKTQQLKLYTRRFFGTGHGWRGWKKIAATPPNDPATLGGTGKPVVVDLRELTNPGRGLVVKGGLAWDEKKEEWVETKSINIEQVPRNYDDLVRSVEVKNIPSPEAKGGAKPAAKQKKSLRLRKKW
jgi:hypothetical protein